MFKLIIKRFLLVIIGLILSLVLLECGLRLAGWTISSYQQYKNNKALRNKSQYTIMCVGESTTAGQYPIQLQQILNEQYPNKFSVIDCGIPGTGLMFILNLLESNIKQFKPNIVICMMGINNGFTEYNKIADIKTIDYIIKNKNLKIYNLFILIKLHLKNLLLSKNISMNSDEININNIPLNEQAEMLQLEGKNEEAAIMLEEMLKKNPNDEKAFSILTSIYIDMYPNIGYKMSVEAINKNFKIDKESYYEYIFEFCSHNNMIDDIKYYINKALNEDFFIFSTNSKYYIYSYIKNYITDEQKNKLFDTMIQHNDTDFGFLAINAIKQKNLKKAKEYFNKAEKLRLSFPNIETYYLYKLIIKKLIDNNIKTICMQYPVRSIKPLKKQLKTEYYFNKLTFISNEKLFKDALMKITFDEIFKDQFAGDFGHCLDLGNTLIAKNVVNTLEQILDLKENKI